MAKMSFELYSSGTDQLISNNWGQRKQDAHEASFEYAESARAAQGMLPD